VTNYLGTLFTRIRNITKPVSGTVLVGIDNVDQSSGWSVDAATGIITFSSPPAQGTLITAGFEFDVPSRFETNLDELLGIRHDDFSSGDIDELNLVELISELPVYEDFHQGGGFFADYTGGKDTNFSFSILTAYCYDIHNSTPTKKILLPDKNKIGPGGPIFAICRNHAGYDCIEPDGTVALTLPANNTSEFVIARLEDGTLKWFGFGEEFL
jgi:hypothetical protein